MTRRLSGLAKFATVLTLVSSSVVTNTVRAEAELEVKELRVACRKTDLEIQPLMLVWTPWRVGPDGIAQPAYD